VPQTESEMKVYETLKSEHLTIYHRVNDPVHDEFREYVKQRDEFNNHFSEIELNDRIKIWRTMRDVEGDTKKRFAKIEAREKAKKRRT